MSQFRTTHFNWVHFLFMIFKYLSLFNLNLILFYKLNPKMI